MRFRTNFLDTLDEIRIVNKLAGILRPLRPIKYSKCGFCSFEFLTRFSRLLFGCESVRLVDGWKRVQERKEKDTKLNQMAILLMNLLSSTGGSQRDLRFRLLPKWIERWECFSSFIAWNFKPKSFQFIGFSWRLREKFVCFFCWCHQRTWCFNDRWNMIRLNWWQL